MGGGVRITVVAGPENEVPFALARHVLGHVVPADPDGQIRMGLRPFFHYPRRAGDSPAPRIKGELRLPTSRRAIRNVRFAGRVLREAGVTGIDITHRATLTDADTMFLHTLAAVMPVTLRLAPTAGPGGDPPPAGPGRGDGGEGARVLAARDAVAAAAPELRSRLWCRTMAHYLSCGDPWTARWVGEELIAAGIAVDAEVAGVLGSAYLYSDAVHTARDYARIALTDSPDGPDSPEGLYGPGADPAPADPARGDLTPRDCETGAAGGVARARERARAIYTLAIIEQRYLPAGMRRPQQVPVLLDRARALLDTVAFDAVASEIVLVANATALHHLDAGRGEQACATVRETIGRIVEHGYAGTTAHAILLSNLGRASARTFGAVDNTEALTALRGAVAIEGDNPEGWLDLAHHLAGIGQFTEAIDAARSGLLIVDMFPDLHDILGYCLAAGGRHADAAQAYLDGLHAGGDPAVLGPAAVRQFLTAAQAGRARDVLAALPSLAADPAAAAEVAVLALEADQADNPDPDPDDVVARLTEIVDRFPDSGLARDNLTAARAWQAAHHTRPGAPTTPAAEHAAEHAADHATDHATEQGSEPGTGHR